MSDPITNLWQFALACLLGGLLAAVILLPIFWLVMRKWVPRD